VGVGGVIYFSQEKQAVNYFSTFNWLKVAKLWGELIELALSLLQGTCLRHL
jgi:hypothetical protein